MSEWYLLAVMALTTYRLTRLVVRDDFPPALWLRDNFVGGWRPLTEKEEADAPDHPEWVIGTSEGERHRLIGRRSWVPGWLAELLSCPWCVSGWIAAGTTALTDWLVGVPAPVLAWGAVWALSALLASRDWS